MALKLPRVSEIFPAIQGEGAQIGKPTVFVRFGGCDFRCSWCDSMYAVDPKFKADWKEMHPDAILHEVETLTDRHPILITLSGGNPAIQPLGALIDAGHARRHTFTMETQGSVFAPWMRNLNHLCISPKPPSSGMHRKLDMQVLSDCLQSNPNAVLKFVVFDTADLQWAQTISSAFEFRPVYLQVGNAVDADSTVQLLDKLRWLTEEVMRRRWYRAVVLPQLHVLLHGNQRGV